jgi:hypothetical protein
VTTRPSWSAAREREHEMLQFLLAKANVFGASLDVDVTPVI